MVVELDVVEVNQAPHFSVHSHIPSFWVVLTFEIGGLWGVGDDMRWQELSQLTSEADQPSLALTGLHSLIVLIVDITAV